MIAKVINIKQNTDKNTIKRIRKLEKNLTTEFSLNLNEKQSFGKYKYSRLLSSDYIRITTMLTYPDNIGQTELSFIISSKDEITTNYLEQYIKENYQN